MCAARGARRSPPTTWRCSPGAASATPDRRRYNRPAHRRGLSAGCIDAVKSSGAGISTKLALEFLVLTATRSGEVRGATWDEIDFGDRATCATCATRATCATWATWEIPASRMKASRPHRMPLSARAVGILREAEKLADGSGLVFPGTKRGKPLSDMTLSKLVKELGFDADDDLHGTLESAHQALFELGYDGSEALYRRAATIQATRA
ncbi:MAG: tyrosine-type recombinase/integrase [Proteobacteria bacterium]|nr:tyrosine-type recombinase/integrase [Pseudomonadota bacterium]